MHEGVTASPSFFVSPSGDFVCTKIVFSPLYSVSITNLELERLESIMSLYRQAAYNRSALCILFAKMTK